MNALDDRSYFFDQGIYFECRRCGACCTGSPGIVFVTRDDISRIARYLELSVSHLKKKYLYPYRNGYSVLEDSDGRCLFYEKECRIYPVRPGQCSTFPFWFENFRSSKAWRRISKECPGIGSGRLYVKKEILELVRLSMDLTLQRHVIRHRDDRLNPAGNRKIGDG